MTVRGRVCEDECVRTSVWGRVCEDECVGTRVMKKQVYSLTIPDGRGAFCRRVDQLLRASTVCLTHSIH